MSDFENAIRSVEAYGKTYPTVAVPMMIEWLRFLQSHYPDYPPTYVVPDPEMNGSLMLERWHDTENRVVELTFRADGDIECCYYNQSKVVLYVRALPKDILIRKSFPLWLCDEEFPHERMFNS